MGKNVATVLLKAEKEGNGMKKKIPSYHKKEWLAAFLFLLPNLAGFLVFTFLPVVLGFMISLTDYSGYGAADFVGLDNYLRMFRDSSFRISLKNNLVYTFTTVPLTISLSLMLALMVNRKMYGAGFFKSVYFFPNLTSMVAVSCVWLQILASEGPVNQFLRSCGMENPPKWFWGISSAMTSIVIVVVWKQIGYYMIMFLGGLKNIPQELFEAAKMDGAGAWACFWNVTWPMLSPTTFMITILTMIGSFQVFDVMNVTTEGGPGRATRVLVMEIYDQAFQYRKMGYGAAIGYFLFLIIFVITLIQWHGQKKWVVE